MIHNTEVHCIILCLLILMYVKLNNIKFEAEILPLLNEGEMAYLK